MINKREIGSSYEDKAEEYLRQLGFEVLERNFRCKTGEIDIIAKEENYLVFVEVKYRRDDRLGLPQEAVDVRKQQKICRTSDYYRMKKKLGEETPVRFDVVWVLGKRTELIRNAFDYR